MSRTHALAFALSIAATSALVPTLTHAVQRTHVSAAFGADANTATNCTAVAPCRFFQAAMTVTDNNGEVIVLDSGGYGAVTITKSVALIAPTGVYAGISVFPGSSGVTIATPNINVVLRGLTINGQGGNIGINMIADGNRFTVVNCVISNLNQTGVSIDGSSVVCLTDTTVQDNSGAGIYLLNGVNATIARTVVSGHVRDAGIRVLGSVVNSATTANIADSIVNGNGTGVFVLGTGINNNAAKVAIRDSRVMSNSSTGLYVQANAGGAASLSASNNLVANNAFGITAALAGAKVWASGNTVIDNVGSGFQNSGALFDSAGNNAVRNNGANSGVITTVVTQ